MQWRISMLASFAALAVATPAAAYECEPLPPGTYSSEICPYSEAITMGGPSHGRIVRAVDVAVASDGRIAVADQGASRAVVFNGDGSVNWVLGGTYVVGANAVAFAPDGSVYVAEDGRIHHHAADGAELGQITEGLQSDGYVRLHDLAVDGDGRIYGAANDSILVWSPAGALERTLSWPGGTPLAAGGSGRLFVRDSQAAQIRELTATGTNVRSYPGGTFAFGTDGRLYVSSNDGFDAYDANGDDVATIPRAGTFGGYQLAAGPNRLLAIPLPDDDRVTAQDLSGASLEPLGTNAGTGLADPSAVAVTPEGRVYVADTRNRRIVEFSPDGTFARVVRSLATPPKGVDDAPGGGLAVVTETGVVGRLADDGSVVKTWALPGDFVDVRGLAVSPSGDVWVREGMVLNRFSTDGVLLGQITVGTGGFGAGYGFAIAGDGTLLAAAENQIRRFGGSGGPSFPAANVEGIAVDGGGNVFAVDQRAVRVFTRDGAPAFSWGEHGTTAGRMQLPWDVDLDARGYAYVLDKWGHRVFRFKLQPPQVRWPPIPAAPVGSKPGEAAATVITIAARNTMAITARGELRLRVSCSADCAGSLQLRSGKRRVALAKFAAKARKAVTVRLRLSRSARKALVRRRKLKVTAVAAVAGAKDARRAITLKLKRR